MVCLICQFEYSPPQCYFANPEVTNLTSRIDVASQHVDVASDITEGMWCYLLASSSKSATVLLTS